MAKKAPAKKAPAKRKPRAKKPVDGIELSELSDSTKKRLAEILDAKTEPPKSIAWRSWLCGWGKSLCFGLVSGLFVLVVCFGPTVFIQMRQAWDRGLIPIGPGPQKPDVISAVFDEQESALRELSGERAKALRAGSIKSEAESVSWMQSRFLPRVEASWAKLLTTEAAEFGGEKWTAEKEAATIERYVR